MHSRVTQEQLQHDETCVAFRKAEDVGDTASPKSMVHVGMCVFVLLAGVCVNGIPGCEKDPGLYNWQEIMHRSSVPDSATTAASAAEAFGAMSPAHGWIKQRH